MTAPGFGPLARIRCDGALARHLLTGCQNERKELEREIEA
jgi:hypothetical protein